MFEFGNDIEDLQLESDENDIFTGSKMPTLSSWRSSISLHKVAKKKGISTLKSWHFEASEDIITKFKSQNLYAINSNIEKLVGVASLPPSLPPSRK